MIIQANAADFAALLSSRAPRGLRLVPDSVIAPLEVLQMLGDLAARIALSFEPSAWLVVENDEVVGLCSAVRVPTDGELHIGYGVAPSRQGGGAATGAIASLVAWARMDRRVERITANTAVDNIPSQKVLERNCFGRIGNDIDPDDGPVICWELRLT
ncbi:GNAT family N-acetyltransferase [Luteibacter sp. NPDC031894]|uniref:GNAT family N-acetyltransferase n=1 Tax=Luteibacter sp. NPDC031894 TaxID=3390572 RepID=UPI003D031432